MQWHDNGRGRDPPPKLLQSAEYVQNTAQDAQVNAGAAYHSRLPLILAGACQATGSTGKYMARGVGSCCVSVSLPLLPLSSSMEQLPICSVHR